MSQYLNHRRRAYAEEIRASAHVRSLALVEAFAKVPRERFLGPGPWQIVSAAGRNRIEYVTTADADPSRLYADILVAIDATRTLNNGLPSGLAQWIDCLDLHRGERVVHLGCGTGYYTAILADVVGPTGHVVGIEVDSTLATRARENLVDVPHIDVVEGDGTQVNADSADAVFVNAGVTHPLAVWIEALRVGGRLLLPITCESGYPSVGFGRMFRITRHTSGYVADCVSPVAIYHCAVARDADANQQLYELRDRDANVRSFRRDVHHRDETCWLHLPDGCFSER